MRVRARGRENKSVRKMIRGGARGEGGGAVEGVFIGRLLTRLQTYIRRLLHDVWRPWRRCMSVLGPSHLSGLPYTWPTKALPLISFRLSCFFFSFFFLSLPLLLSPSLLSLISSRKYLTSLSLPTHSFLFLFFLFLLFLVTVDRFHHSSPPPIPSFHYSCPFLFRFPLSFSHSIPSLIYLQHIFPLSSFLPSIPPSFPPSITSSIIDTTSHFFPRIPRPDPSLAYNTGRW